MNLRELLTKLFRKRSVVQDTLVLMDINNIINIPTRKKYKKDKDALNTIDKFKKEYKTILMQDKTITSIDLHSKYLKEEMDIYLDILKESYFSIGGYTGLDTLSNEDILTYKINVLKLKIYKDKINELQKEIELRLIALNELSLRIKTNRSKNKDALSEEITNLSFAYYIYESQKLAINNAIESYKHMFLMNNNTLIGDYDKYKEARLNRIENYIKDILPDIYEKSKDLDVEAKLALYEFYLEVWAHKKENINEAKKIIDSISREYRIDNLYDEETREYLLNLISSSEPTIRTIYDFNKGKINDDLIYEFYEAKYEAMTIVINNESPFRELYNEYRDNIEYTVYEKIVQERIDRIVNGNLGNIFNKKEIIELLIKLFKNNDMYDICGILNKPILIRLLNIVTEFIPTYDEIIDFFDSIYLEINDGLCNEQSNKEILLDKKISIRNVYGLIGGQHNVTYEINKDEFLSLAKNYADHTNLELNYNLYKLYSYLADVVEDEDSLVIPKGTRKIRFNDGIIDHLNEIILTNIKENFNKRNLWQLVLPDTMEELDLNYLYNMHIDILVLNEGLKKLYLKKIVSYGNEFIEVPIIKLPKLFFEELIIPSTLETIDWNWFGSEKLKYIIFTNFKESKILKNKELIRLLLEKCCKYVVTFDGNNNPKLTINFNTYVVMEDENGIEFEIKQLSKIISWSNVISLKHNLGYYYYPSSKEKRIIEDWIYKKIEKLIDSKEIFDEIDNEEEKVFKLQK